MKCKLKVSQDVIEFIKEFGHIETSEHGVQKISLMKKFILEKNVLFLENYYYSDLFENIPAIYSYKGVEVLVQYNIYDIGKLLLTPCHREHDLGNGCGMKIQVDTLDFMSTENKKFIRSIKTNTK